MVLCKSKGDFQKCIPIYLAGAVLIICGLPLMITGIAGTFSGADLVGYVGGICIIFGLGFFLLWYMFTIETKDSHLSGLEYDPNLKTINDVIRKSKAKEKSMEKGLESAAFANLAFENDRSDGDHIANDTVIDGDGAVGNQNPSDSARTNSNEDDGEIQRDVNSETGSASDSPDVEVVTADVTSSHEDTSDSARSSSRQSVPVEVA